MAYQIQSKTDGQWNPECVGDVDANRFESRSEAETAVGDLRKLGPTWERSEYRVVEVD